MRGLVSELGLALRRGLKLWQLQTLPTACTAY